jgi:hypothetical protein
MNPTETRSSLLFGVLLLLILVPIAPAQPSEKTIWIKLLGYKNDMTVEVPSDDLYDKDLSVTRFFARGRGMWIYMNIASGFDAAHLMKNLDATSARDGFSCATIKVAHSVGEVCSSVKEGYLMQMRLGTQQAMYEISIAAESLDTPDLRRFMGSMRVEGQEVFRADSGTMSVGEIKEVSLGSLKRSSLCEDAVNSPESKEAKVVYDLDGKYEFGLEEPTEILWYTIKYSRPLIVLRQPRADFKPIVAESPPRGVVKLRVVFGKNGQISEITVLQAADPAQTRSSIEAVKKIKFLPAEIDGKPVAITRVLRYGVNVR